MKILMLAPQPFFEPRGTPYSILGRLKALSQLGHQVDLVTYHLGQDVCVPNVVIYRTPRIKFIKDLSVGPSLTKLFLDVLLLVKAFHFLKKGHYDLLHTHEEASFFGIVLAKLFGIRHLYDMHSSLPQQLSNFQFTRFRPLIRFFEWLEYRTVNSSDAIITICPALEERVKGINSHVSAVVIENVASEDSADGSSEEDVEKIKLAYCLDGKKIILYAGTFEPYQGLHLLVASAEQILRRRRDVVFLLLGGKGNQVEHYRKLVAQVGLSSHFHFTGTIPVEEIPLFIRLANILVSPRIRGSNTPLKIYSYLKSGKPIVATNIMAHTQVLNSDVAILTDPSPSAFAGGILRVLEDEYVADRITRRAARLAEEKFGIEEFVQKTRWILEQVRCNG